MVEQHDPEQGPSKPNARRVRAIVGRYLEAVAAAHEEAASALDELCALPDPELVALLDELGATALLQKSPSLTPGAEALLEGRRRAAVRAQLYRERAEMRGEPDDRPRGWPPEGIDNSIW